ncbi:MAG: hypothetical protein ACP5OY_08710 [Halothiobacillaceae bacterium]
MPKLPAKDREVLRLRNAIRRILPPVLQKLYQLAIAGDVQAAKLLLDRALPALTPVRDAVVLNGETPAEWKADLLGKVAGGEVAPREALALLELFERAPDRPGDKPTKAIPAETLAAIRETLYGKENKAHDAE